MWFKCLPGYINIKSPLLGTFKYQGNRYLYLKQY